MVSFALLLLSVLPQDGALKDRCARLETNNVYSSCGQFNFTQVIGWEPSGRVFFWRMQKGQIKIARDYDNREWCASWCEDGALREVRALSHDETWEQFDVEVADRELLPVAYRRPMQGVR